MPYDVNSVEFRSWYREDGGYRGSKRAFSATWDFELSANNAMQIVYNSLLTGSAMRKNIGGCRYGCRCGCRCVRGCRCGGRVQVWGMGECEWMGWYLLDI